MQQKSANGDIYFRRILDKYVIYHKNNYYMHIKSFANYLKTNTMSKWIFFNVLNIFMREGFCYDPFFFTYIIFYIDHEIINIYQYPIFFYNNPTT